MTVKPLVKHILSKELLLYFEKICDALIDEASDEYRLAALASIRTDPGLHQLVPYFVQFIAEKVTHNLRNLFILTQMMQFSMAMLENDSLYVDPYVSLCLISPMVATSLITKDRITYPSHNNLPRWSALRTKLYNIQPYRLKLVLSATLPCRFDSSNYLQEVFKIFPYSEASSCPNLSQELSQSRNASSYSLWEYRRLESHWWSRGCSSANCSKFG